ncbi:Sensor protein SrrB [compost metagenome]
MLSKLQFQVIKLKEILIAQNKKVKKERDDIKSLISDISHQIKTPVSNLEIYYELLKDPNISKEQREDFIVNIKSQLRKLNFLMDSMIKISRLESGIIKLNPKLGNLNETCLTAVKQVYQKALNKNIKIEFIEKDNINMSYDANWTSEAIFNILDNAVKYTNINGEIIISIEKYSIYSRIDIKDNGTGLLEEEINNIFKRFYRGENSQKEEGVGLGLYLAREIITKQNGYIKVNSLKGSGTCFSIFLPI